MIDGLLAQQTAHPGFVVEAKLEGRVEGRMSDLRVARPEPVGDAIAGLRRPNLESEGERGFEADLELEVIREGTAPDRREAHGHASEQSEKG